VAGSVDQVELVSLAVVAVYITAGRRWALM